MSQLTSSVSVAAFTQSMPGALPTTHVETDPAQCREAKIAHFCGIFGILGTGIYYLVKRKEAGPFAADQMKEAFNFHLLLFCVTLVLSVAGSIVAAVVGMVGIVFSLASMALAVGGLVLSILNALKAGKGQVARYPARLSALK